MIQDLRYAIRMVRQSPMFSLVAILVMGLGIGANSAVFALVDSVFLKPLPFHDPEQLVMVWEDAAKFGYPRNDVAFANYLDWKEQAGGFVDLAAFFGNAFNLTGEGTPERLDGIQTTPDLFPLLGVRPEFGRWFNNTEGQPDASRVTILSQALWKRRFGGDPAILGRSILINDQPHVVVGIMPAGFQFPRGDTQLWIPIQFPRAESNAQGRSNHFLHVAGRLQTGVSWQQAESRLRGISQSLGEMYPVTNRDIGVLVVPLRREFISDVHTVFWLLLGASLLVLLIACSNVANMLVTRGIGRTREIAVRSALGATRMRVARQLFVEGLLLSVAGSVAGLLIAAATMEYLTTLIPPSLAGAVSLSPDLRLLGFAVLMSLCTGVAFGLVPLRSTFRIDLSRSFRAKATNFSHSGSRGLLVSFETAMALVVIACTGLFLRTIANIGAVDPGFHSENILTLRLELSPTQYASVENRVKFYKETLDRVQSLPGVISAGFTTFLPYTNFGGSSNLVVQGRTDLPLGTLAAYRREITPAYPATLGIPLLKGRWFNEQDDKDHPLVTIITESAARQFQGDPIGQQLKLGNPDGPWLTIVGVAGDMREEGLTLPSERGTAYTPAAQIQEVWYFNPRDLAIRVAGNPTNLAAAVQREIWAIDPNQPISQVRTLDTIVEQQVASRKVQATLLSTFSLLAISLAALGVYALLSFVVEARTQEFGIRMALGAKVEDLVASVFRQSLVWIGSGALAGLAITMIVTRSLSSLLYAVAPADPLTLAASVLLLLAVGALAACIPAWRATRIDPVVALRHD